ncbi:MAG: iron chelate uptake ABC transporter family permease subunit [Nitrospiraceae bacterium]|nr:iron chelate uptake ABC transporter family permease subunit [Nitrospiraceae bacterium]
MSEFVAALSDGDIPFLRYALLAGLVASVPFGIMGAYVTTRRISYIAGSIAHCALGGVGAALYFQSRLGLEEYGMLPLCGAVAQALLAAVLIGLVSLYGREREDTVIGAVWALGMAQGLLFMAKTPGYVDPMNYLFGRIVLISRQDLWVVGILAAVVVVLALFFYNKLVAVCFDDEFARVRGVRVGAYYLLLLCLTAVTVVLMMTVVGIVLVIALLTLPAATAGHYSRRIWQMMALGVLLCMAFTTSGMALAYTWDFPTGPMIVMVGSGVYLASVASHRWLKTGV